EQAWAGGGIYAAAKAGLNQFSRSLCGGMRPYNVKATVRITSWGATGFWAQANRPAFSGAVSAKMTNPQAIRREVTYFSLLPPHLAIPELTLLPLVQEISPY